MQEVVLKEGFIIQYEDGFQWEHHPSFPPGWDEYPCLYESEAAAIRDIAEDQMEIWRQVHDGERDIDDIWEVPSVVGATVYGDGHMETDDESYSPRDLKRMRGDES